MSCDRFFRLVPRPAAMEAVAFLPILSSQLSSVCTISLSSYESVDYNMNIKLVQNTLGNRSELLFMLG